MRSKFLLPLSIFLFSVFSVLGQDQFPPKDSRNSYELPKDGNLHIPVIYVQLVNDSLRPESKVWPLDSFPSYFNWLLDRDTFTKVKKPKGISNFTDYFEEMSFGKCKITGIPYPTVIKINPKGYRSFYEANSAVVDSINRRQRLGIDEEFYIDQFDNWTLNANFKPKINRPDGKIDLVIFIYRNTRDAGWNGGSGGIWMGYRGKLLGKDAEFSFVSARGLDPPYPLDNMAHEVSHGFLGGNQFHNMSGTHSWNLKYGNTTHFGLNGGWGMIGHGFIFKSCNGWDRDRIGWTNPGQRFYDFDKEHVPNNGLIVKLRDFIASGDVVRLKLPNIPDDQLPQYIWIENHQKKSFFDHSFFELQAPCFVEQTVPGLYMFYQVGMDNHFDFDVKRDDFLRPISGEGNFDYELLDTTVSVCMTGVLELLTRKGLPNPLSGYDDISYRFFDVGIKETGYVGDGVIMANNYPSNKTTQLNNTCFLTIKSEATEVCWPKYIGNGGNIDALPAWVEEVNGKIEEWKAVGPEESFQKGDKIGLGTNPSTASYHYIHKFKKDDHGNYKPIIRPENKIYLNGLSIEVTGEDSGMYTLLIKYNQWDVAEDVRWCAGEIVLTDTIILKEKKTILLDQSQTPNSCFKFDNGYFAPSTTMVCKKGAFIELEKKSRIVIKNGSTLIFDEGSNLEFQRKARIIVKNGGALIIPRKIVRKGTRCKIKKQGSGKIEYF